MGTDIIIVTDIGTDMGTDRQTDMGGWTPKIDRATWPFLRLSDMRQELS